MEEYSDFHRLMLQYILSKKAVRETELKKDAGQDDLARPIQLINRRIHALGLSIEQVKDEQGDVWVGVVNTMADKLAQVATPFDENQIELLKGVVRAGERAAWRWE